MKYFKTVLLIALASLNLTISAQANNEDNNYKDNSRARIENVRWQNALVMKSGRTTEIAIKIEADTWRIFDSIVSGPWGSAVKLKDLDGYNVDVAKANISNSVGLLFTSGSKCVALKKEELDALKH